MATDYKPGIGASEVVADIKATADQAIANATTTVLDLDTATLDPEDWWEGVTNPERITVPAGKGGDRYRLFVLASLDPSATGRRVLDVRLNGGSPIGRVEVAPTSGPWSVQLITDHTPADGDYYEATIYQSSGGSLNTRSADAGQEVRVIVTRMQEAS